MSLSHSVMSPPGVITPALATLTTKTSMRMLAIDALRGFVMLLMLVDHVRETFFLHHQVSDPIDALSVTPDLYFTRLLSTLCAPVFIFLTGLSAWLYSQKHSAGETSLFLLKRGLFLILLELTFVCFAWNAEFPPKTLWLQVIWCIGLCMIALAALLHLKRGWLIVLAIVIVAGHNLFDGVVLGPDSPFFVPWSILHQRAFIDITEFTRARTTYPVLPWIGVILLGWAIGPWFGKEVESAVRLRRLFKVGIGMLLAFVLIRYLNVYGDKPWIQTGDALRTVMSFLSATKYPPSLMFLMPTLGVGLILLACFEKAQERGAIALLGIYGGAPMFFYLLHLYVLKALYLLAMAIWGANQGAYFGFDHLPWVWLWSVLLGTVLFFPTRWFAGFKQRRRDIAILKYF
ncbi:membrane protein, putative [Pseudomonas fluorescens Q2-87]|uniref:Membrane protein, putative n=2 Tax=Pseudomonas fluorescens TaxID=294 RepID=J2EI23_PSEFQ|nr:heparan-alpha-glucosaminide N-acetyltransferase domain-containing protein [Pseudomonas fluorescens]EJL03060.1 membrane protein, putative [Pseudomonas fluorescens Q2-87]